MHIPDGFLTTKTWVALTALSGGVTAAAAAQAKQKMSERRIPLMGIMAAFVFAAQMLNFPVAAGTSGHFVGGVLVSVLLGPSTGILIMACVLGVQCLVFQDGGITALGANIFNMGIVGVFFGYGVYVVLCRLLRRVLRRATAMQVSAAIASWVAIVMAAAACAVELALSGVVPLKIALPAMAGIHVVIGIGEGAVTALVIGFILKVRPDLLGEDKA
jgi:cobalt/nickel transport system permease protein